MSSKKPNYPLRVDRVLLNKMKHIAKQSGRSLNKEIEQLIKRYVGQYEETHGSISVDEE